MRALFSTSLFCLGIFFVSQIFQFYPPPPGGQVRPKVARSVHYCEETKKFVTKVWGHSSEMEQTGHFHQNDLVLVHCMPKAPYFKLLCVAEALVSVTLVPMINTEKTHAISPPPPSSPFLSPSYFTSPVLSWRDLHARPSHWWEGGKAVLESGSGRNIIGYRKRPGFCLICCF